MQKLFPSRHIQNQMFAMSCSSQLLAEALPFTRHAVKNQCEIFRWLNFWKVDNLQQRIQIMNSLGRFFLFGFSLLLSELKGMGL